MPIVDINIHGSSYSLSCGEGEERHLKELGVYLDRKSRMLVPSSNATELQIMLITAVTLADELNESSNEIANLKEKIESLQNELSKKKKG